PTAEIADGRIIGTTTKIAGPTGSILVNKFLGIPFAAPPIGNLRFSPPHAPPKWIIRDAKEFENSCVQVFSPLDGKEFTEAVFNNPPPKKESEDCLYINVFAPKKAWTPMSPPYPVLYWMYGGGWKFGHAGHPWYDGSHFAALEDVIVVSVNYRTNAFGFPIAPGVPLEGRNLGMLDQRAGLEWVEKNIHHFGGDKDKVTIFGESAGAFATDSLITSYKPGAQRRFRAAIMESGTYAYLRTPNCNNSNFEAWNLLAAGLGCPDNDDAAKFNCIKNERNDIQIKDAQERNSNITFQFACDEKTLVSNPRTRLEAGETADVPVMLGTNTQDGSVYSIGSGFDASDYFNKFLPNNETLKQRVLDAYPLGQDGRNDEQLRLAQIHTDWFFHCPSVWYGETSAAKLRPTYRYLFNATFTNTQAQYPRWDPYWQGAYHSSEIPIVFTTYNESVAPAEPTQRGLSDMMRKAWANFAKHPSQPP
ncbi:alpha/beta-hydrolase, partial [Lojkania enalia]